MPLSFEAKQVDDDTDLVTAVVGDAPATAVNRDRIPYREAAFAVNTSIDPHEAPIADMAGYVVKIVQIEGPIHIDEIITRIRTLWGLQRAGSRIRNAVEYAAKIAAARGLITGDPFYIVPGQKIMVRDRSAVGATTLRKPEMLPPAEIDEAVLEIVNDNFGASREELVLAVSRTFGYSSTSTQLRAVLESAIDRLIASSALEIKSDLLVRRISQSDTESCPGCS